MKRYMEHLIRSAEKRVDHFLNIQVTDEKDLFYGGMKSGILEAKPTIYVMADAASVYLNQNSRYYKNENLLTAMEAAVSFIANCQRDDGSFDYPSCNFKSAPDTSFCFKRLIATYRLFINYTKEGELNRLKEGYHFLLVKSLNALLTGGFHTPNHRWGITAALMQGASLVKEETDSPDTIFTNHPHTRHTSTLETCHMAVMMSSSLSQMVTGSWWMARVQAGSQGAGQT